MGNEECDCMTKETTRNLWMQAILTVKQIYRMKTVLLHKHYTTIYTMSRKQHAITNKIRLLYSVGYRPKLDCH